LVELLTSSASVAGHRQAGEGWYPGGRAAQTARTDRDTQMRWIIVTGAAIIVLAVLLNYVVTHLTFN